jgi:DNA-binding PadR family transcriptional regulator
MQEPTFWILTALADAPQHGYSILSTVEDLSGNQVKLKVPTLYQALDRLQKSGLVEVDKEIVVDGRFRRYFKLTKMGRIALRRRKLLGGSCFGTQNLGERKTGKQCWAQFLNTPKIKESKAQQEKTNCDIALQE